MKAVLENISKQTYIRAFSFELPYFEFKWHYHPEFELTLITKGKGNRLVGDSYETFSNGDLVLLGSGIPHTWESETNHEDLSVAAVVIQFSDELFSNFKEIEEFASIKKLLELSAKGLFFKSLHQATTDKIINLEKQNGIRQVTGLIDILQDLSELEVSSLASDFYTPKINTDNENRINEVFNYIRENINVPIQLEHAALKVHLSKQSFCKFFKRMTGKTFSDYVNEVRIGSACYMLTETDKTISQIALETGFENQAYFNRVFLKKKNCTPKKFRMQFLK